MRASARWWSPPGAGVTILRIASAAANLPFTGHGIEIGRGSALAYPGKCSGEFTRLGGRAIAIQPVPHRRQRDAPDLTRPRRKIAFNQKRLQRAEQQPRRIVGARPGILFRSAHHLAQLFEHEGRDRGVFTALDGALELPHQQRLSLRRKLCEIIPQPLGRCLAHAYVMHVVADGPTRPLRMIKAPALRFRLGIIPNARPPWFQSRFDTWLNCNYNINSMKIVWDEPKRLANIARHGMDFADLDEAFFESSIIVPAKPGRLIAIGRHRNGIILVVFVALGAEGLSVVSMRAASRKERRLIDG